MSDQVSTRPLPSEAARAAELLYLGTKSAPDLVDLSDPGPGGKTRGLFHHLVEQSYRSLAMRTALKLAISPPLEAGPSLLDSHSLPPRVPQALEHISSRLAARALHATFLLVRQDCQLPPSLAHSSSSSASISLSTSLSSSSSSASSSYPSSTSSSSSSSSSSYHRHQYAASPHGVPAPFTPITPTSSPSSLGFGRFAAASLRRQLSDLTSRGLSSPISPASPSPRFLWPRRQKGGITTPAAGTREDMALMPSPLTPGSTWSPCQPSGVSPWMPPATPLSPAPAPAPSTPSLPNAIRLIYVPLGDAKAEEFLADLIRKAERKFQVHIIAIPSTDAATRLLLRNSIAQSYATPASSTITSATATDTIPSPLCSSPSSTIFSSEGVTILPLDGLYAFKSALAAHVRCPSPYSLQHAADELHRLVVSRGGRKVSKADVLRSYDWLAAPVPALVEVEKEYRSMYALSGGGPFSRGGFLVDDEEAAKKDSERKDKGGRRTSDSSDRETTVTDDDDDESEERQEVVVAEAVEMQLVTAITTTAIPKGLRVQTTFNNSGRIAAPRLESAAPALPRRNPLRGIQGSRRGGMVIDSIPGFGFGIGLGLVPLKSLRSSTDSTMSKKSDERVSYRLGPRTPNAYDDITPVTRGEWRMLMANGELATNTATVEMCV